MKKKEKNDFQPPVIVWIFILIILYIVVYKLNPVYTAQYL